MSRECSMCQFSELYRDRLICWLFKCSAPFARHDETQCGERATRFERRG